MFVTNSNGFFTFQFHKVRLRGIDQLSYKTALLFQFHKVRLRAKLPSDYTSNIWISIP